MMSSVYWLLMNEPIDHTTDTITTNDTSPDEGTSVSLVLPSPLHCKLKSQAALAGSTLKNYLVGILASAETRGAP